MREAEGETYLTLQEVTEKYSWVSSTLYLFRSMDLLNTYKFVGDKKTYWKISELEAVKNRPPEITKRGPKSHALIKPSIEVPGRARRILVGGVSAPSSTY